MARATWIVRILAVVMAVALGGLYVYDHAASRTPVVPTTTPTVVEPSSEAVEWDIVEGEDHLGFFLGGSKSFVSVPEVADEATPEPAMAEPASADQPNKDDGAARTFFAGSKSVGIVHVDEDLESLFRDDSDDGKSSNGAPIAEPEPADNKRDAKPEAKDDVDEQEFFGGSKASFSIRVEPLTPLVLRETDWGEVVVEADSDQKLPSQEAMPDEEQESDGTGPKGTGEREFLMSTKSAKVTLFNGEAASISAELLAEKPKQAEPEVPADAFAGSSKAKFIVDVERLMPSATEPTDRESDSNDGEAAAATPISAGAGSPPKQPKHTSLLLAGFNFDVVLKAMLAAGLGLLILCVLFSPLEMAFPARRQRFFRPAWWTDLCFFLGQNLLWLGIVFWLLSRGANWLDTVVPGQFRAAIDSQPWYLQAIEVILLSDLLIYWGHRLQHRVGFLWRFHSIHHSAEHLDFLAAFREHPLDSIYTISIINLPMILLGFPVETLAGLVAFRGLWAIYIHSNVRLPIGPLRVLIGAPELHHWHHDLDRDAGNYANLSPLMDVLFGTYRCPDREPEHFGIREPIAKRYVGQMLHPFRPASATSKHGDDDA